MNKKTTFTDDTNPLVSIIVPVYNTGDTLMETIASIQSQTYNRIETIVVNDGSNDKDTLDKINNLDSSINVVHQENKGLPAARNTGAKIAKGEYIICLDSDDCIGKKYVEKIVNEFQSSTEPKLGVVSTYVQAFGVSNEQWNIPDFDVEKIKYSNVLPVASAFTKEAWQSVGGYDETFRKGFEDWEFWLSIIEKGYVWEVVKKPLFYYRRKKTSMITGSNKNREEICKTIIKKHTELYQETEQEVLNKMLQAESDRSSKRSYVSIAKNILSGNFLKRFRMFR